MLKETADLSWQADMNTLQQTKLIYSPGHDRGLRQVTDELGIELNLLYRYLITLAIQYLAIGLLVAQEPEYFLQRQTGYHIVALLESAGVALTPRQRRLLAQTESAYGWAERYPAGELGGSHDALRQISHRLSEMDNLSGEEKTVLEVLFMELEERVVRATDGH